MNINITSIQYNLLSPSQILIDGGYITFSNNNPICHYYLQDHLGNNRVVFRPGDYVEQVNHYYPFGGLMGESTGGNVQKYKYNGKELDRMNGLDWYDYGARHYDAAIASWPTMDPLCEKYYSLSPYVYCHNNPVMMVDPDGRDDYYTSSGEFLYRDNKETDNIIIRNQFLYDMKSMSGAEWINPDTPIENCNLSAEAYSNIFTNILSQMEDVNVGELHNKKISVTVWKNSGDNLSKSTNDQYNDATLSDETLAETGILKSNGERVLMVYMYPQGTEERAILNTVANIQNLLGAHEFLGHYKKGWKSHSLVVPFQRKHSTWDKTTREFKAYNYYLYGM